MATATPVEPTTEAPPPIPERKTKAKGKAKHPGGRPRKDAPPNPEAEQRFFDKVRAIPQDDWGQRAFMYVYATEPLCNLKTQGGAKFLFKSEAPILDLQKIMADYGSFKGYMTLNLRKPGDKQGDQVDRFDFEIYNPNYPPKIPRAVWIEDERNKKWAALLPPEQAQPAQQPAADPMQIFRVVREIQRDERERMEDMQPEPAPVPDPVAQLTGVATVFKALKGENGNDSIVKLMELQQKSQDAAMQRMATELAESRKEQAALQMKLIEMGSKAPAESEVTKKVMDKALEKLLNPADEAIPARARNQPWWADAVGSLIEQLPNSPVMANFSTAALIWAQSIAQKNNGQTQHVMPPQPRPQPVPPRQTIDAPPPAAQEQPQQQEAPAPPVVMSPGMKFTPEQLKPFVGLIAEPLQNILNTPDADGFMLREWMLIQKGPMQYELVRNQGPETLLAAIRLSPFWQGFQLAGYPQHPGFAHFEPQLKQLIEDFCSDPPDEDEDDSDEGDQVENDMKPEELFR